MNTTSNDYYKVGGSLDRDTPSYGVRQADEDFYQALKAGEFCYVLNSRQMGKSSLRVRTVARLEAEGIACSQIDITSIGSRGITASEWYWGVVRRLARSFKISIDLKTWWQERAEASPVDLLSQFIEEVLLVEVQSSIAIFIDEIDSILNLDFKDDFFALIRTCYNQRAENPEYRRLTFALLGVATPSDLIQDKSRTPFNIGRSIDLRGLQLHEAEPLAQGLQEKAEDAIAVLKSIVDWTGGQPFLTQKICQFVQSETDWIPVGQEAERVRSLVQARVIENWEGQDEPEHLRTIQNRVAREDDHKGQLLGLYQQVLEQGAIPATESEEQIRLRLSGLVVKDQGQLKLHNRIYAAVFDRTWTERILAELRPYAEAITIWLKSEGQDESRLLRGNALEEAQRWAVNKHLSEQDVRFLSASEQAEKRVMLAEKHILTEANQKANRLLKITIGVLGVAIVAAVGTGIWANAKLKPIEEELTRRQAELSDIWEFSRGQSALYSGKQLEAIRIFDRILTRNSRNSFVRISRAEIYLAQKNSAKAIEELQTVLKFDPKNVAALNALGTIMRDKKNLDEAVELYQQAIAIDPKNAFAYNNLGLALEKKAKLVNTKNTFDEPINLYKIAIKLDPKYVDTYNNLGNALRDRYKLDEATTVYKQALNLDPQYALTYNNLGTVLRDQNKLDEATIAFRTAIDLDPKYALAYNKLGFALKEQNKLNEAIATFQQAIEIDPKDALAISNIGEIYYRQGRKPEALKQLNRAIELDPNLKWAIELRDKIQKSSP